MAHDGRLCTRIPVMRYDGCFSTTYKRRFRASHHRNSRAQTPIGGRLNEQKWRKAYYPSVFQFCTDMAEDTDVLVHQFSFEGPIFWRTRASGPPSCLLES